MMAIAVRPGDRSVALVDVAEPRHPEHDEVLLQILDVGVCGTDREIARFRVWDAPRR